MDSVRSLDRLTSINNHSLYFYSFHDVTEAHSREILKKNTSITDTENTHHYLGFYTCHFKYFSFFTRLP